ncbi:M48 family metallopeptidase [Desulfatitalea alkaliphila]|uniref:M48 family metallopeptidase n=1 Tax=Desulfatitalea alkaliphila TaxID=2929485 RepID=A0AA41R2F6_9BACT|nr:SprT family zinc-dependent metalloprotease [Desulfatitalea alkaliphila]MCJ8500844.1 M48 family metallopeptidase [Desulfatitalea alkaliphila]
MRIDAQRLHIGGITVELRRKPIKHLRLGVCPPDGRVRVSAPLRLDEKAIRQAIIDRLDWIRHHQERLRRRARQSPRELVSGETHYFQGHPYRLEIFAQRGPASLQLVHDTMVLRVPPETGETRSAAVIEKWYRSRLQEQLPALLARWQPIVGVRAAEVRLKRMRTRWGSCNIAARRIWLSLELAKTPTACLEYVLVHELVHLHERYHNAHFKGLMDLFLPSWRTHKAALEQGTWMQEEKIGGRQHHERD